LVSLCGLVALNAMVDSPKFDFPSLSAALAETSLSNASASTIFGLLLFGFGILVALFPFHTWAPRGYEAAPTSVSMLHAGVLKKFGLYGLVQIAAPLLPQAAFEWSEIILWLALGNVILVGFVTLAQNNLKSMIGYGSVMHMGYCFLGIGACSALGAGSAVMLMCAHGLSVALMFLLAQFIYKRTGTYEMNEMGGLASRTPMLACFLVAATLATIGLPGFGNFWGEFGVFLSLGEMTENRFFLGLAALGIIISAIFGLRAVARTLYGSPSEELEKHLEKNSPTDLSRVELLSSGVILAALTLIGLFPSSISERIDGEIGSRYAAFKEVQVSSGRPSCCPVENDTKDSAEADKESVLTNP
jgi:NADH-quinone oxidoreductase subunit M